MDKSSNKARQYKVSEEMILRRKQLIEFSKRAEQVREAEGREGETINEILKEFFYDPESVLTFNAFHQWKKQGYTIKKGEKAFLFWGQPVNRVKKKEGEEQEEVRKEGEESEEDKYTYWPVCYLFSNKQVTKSKRVPKVGKMQEVAEKEVEYIEY